MDRKEIFEWLRYAEDHPAEYDKKKLSGLSGERIIMLLRTFARGVVNNDNVYLEVGVYQGFTLLSVAQSVPEHEVFGIDNFAYFDRQGKNLQIIRERQADLNIKNVRLLNEDYEDALGNLRKHIGERKVSLYFIDGPHDYRSQLMCLLLIKPFLSDNAVIIVDDSNYRHVRQANRDFLYTHPEFKMIFQIYTDAHPSNLEGEERKKAENGWWNGINIMIRDSSNQFDPFYPPTLRDRTLFENEHNIHTIRYPEAVRKYAGIASTFAGLARLKFKKELTGKYNSLNTFSDNLNYERYNPSFNSILRTPPGR